jgi:hypothetical protein
MATRNPTFVAMSGIGAAIPVSEEAARIEAVVVGTLLALGGGRRVDGERHLLQDRGLEDARRTDQGNPAAFEVEATLQDGAWQGRLTETTPLFTQELEGAQADGGVPLGSHGPGV